MYKLSLQYWWVRIFDRLEVEYNKIKQLQKGSQFNRWTKDQTRLMFILNLDEYENNIYYLWKNKQVFNCGKLLSESKNIVNKGLIILANYPLTNIISTKEFSCIYLFLLLLLFIYFFLYFDFFLYSCDFSWIKSSVKNICNDPLLYKWIALTLGSHEPSEIPIIYQTIKMLKKNQI